MTLKINEMATKKKKTDETIYIFLINWNQIYNSFFLGNLLRLMSRNYSFVSFSCFIGISLSKNKAYYGNYT